MLWGDAAAGAPSPLPEASSSLRTWRDGATRGGEEVMAASKAYGGLGPEAGSSSAAPSVVAMVVEAAGACAKVGSNGSDLG